MADPAASDVADRQRIQRIAHDSKAPAWLRAAIALIAENAAAIPPLAEDRAQLPEYIYRH